MKKIVFFDLDGTLLFKLDSGKYGIREEDREAIHRNKDRMKFVFCSGRGCYYASSISGMLGIECDMIGFNGLEMKIGSKITREKSVPIDDFIKFSNVVEKKLSGLGNPFFLYDTGKYALLHPDKEPCNIFARAILPPHTKNIYDEDAMEFIKKNSIREIAKMQIFVYDPKDGQKIKSVLREEFKDQYNFVNSNPHVIEAVISGVSKATGIEKYLKQTNADIEDAYCFGDTENDIEMFELLGSRSFCMEHGSQDAKGKAGNIVKNIAQGLKQI